MPATVTVNGKTYTATPYGFTGNIKTVRDAITTTGTVTFTTPITDVNGLLKHRDRLVVIGCFESHD